jgi:hypothetical protein
MKNLHLAIHPEASHCRLVAMSPGWQPLLKARLLAVPRQPTALPLLLRALAQWQGVPVRAALFAATTPALFAPPHWHTAGWDAPVAMGPDSEPPCVLVVRPPPPPLCRSEARLALGRFTDLEQHLWCEALLS